MIDRDEHYCKHCQQGFIIRVDEDEDRAVFLECPHCKWPHFRQFKDGTAIHCDINRRTNEPVTLRAALRRNDGR